MDGESAYVWKPNKQLTGFLRLWHVIEREGGELLGCARNSFPFLPKTELIPVGYPCVGWLLLLRRRYTHRCLQIWLPPAASDWIQGWYSAPQNTTRKHKMASCTSAILGLVKSPLRSTFQCRFSEPPSSWLRESGVYCKWWSQSCAKSCKDSNRPRLHTSMLKVQSKRATLTILFRPLKVHRKKATLWHVSMFLCV